MVDRTTVRPTSCTAVRGYYYTHEQCRAVTHEDFQHPNPDKDVVSRFNNAFMRAPEDSGGRNLRASHIELQRHDLPGHPASPWNPNRQERPRPDGPKKGDKAPRAMIIYDTERITLDLSNNPSYEKILNEHHATETNKKWLKYAQRENLGLPEEPPYIIWIDPDVAYMALHPRWRGPPKWRSFWKLSEEDKRILEDVDDFGLPEE